MATRTDPATPPPTLTLTLTLTLILTVLTIQVSRMVINTHPRLHGDQPSSEDACNTGTNADTGYTAYGLITMRNPIPIAPQVNA